MPNFDFKEQELEMIPSLKSDCLNIYCRESLWIALRDPNGIQKMNPLAGFDTSTMHPYVIQSARIDNFRSLIQSHDFICLQFILCFVKDFIVDVPNVCRLPQHRF